MTLSLDMQIAILLILYLCRSGRANIADVVLELDLQGSDVFFIASCLADAEILDEEQSDLGDTTYALLGDPTFLDVMKALSMPHTLTKEEVLMYSVGTIEERSLLSFVTSINGALGLVFNRTIRSIGKERVANELAALNKKGLSTASN